MTLPETDETPTDTPSGPAQAPRPWKTGAADYQSGRPFLVVEHYLRPNGNAPTHRKGRGDDPSEMAQPFARARWSAEEHAYVVDCLRLRHLRRASAILDIERGRMAKNRPCAGWPAQADEDAIRRLTARHARAIEEAQRLSRLRHAERAGWRVLDKGVAPSPEPAA